MLVIRKIIQEDESSFQKFCDHVGTTEALEDLETFWGIFDNDELQGYVKIDLQTISVPLISDLQAKDFNEYSIIEGLLRGTFHYCLTQNYEIVAVRDIRWLKNHLEEALDITEKKLYNNAYFYEINLRKFFNKPCKGRSMCQ